MLADDVRVDGGRCDIFHLGEHVAVACGVENRTRADDALVRQAGSLPDRVGEQVDRVGGHEEDAVEAVLHDVAHDGVHDVDVLVHELQAGLARLLSGAGANDDHGGVLAVFVGADRDAGTGRGPNHAVVEVHHVAFELLLIDVNDGQVVDSALVHQCIRVGDSDIACTNQYNLVSHKICHSPDCA